MRRNNALYFFQFIACILVVLIHAPFPGNIGLFFSETGRLAVPLFFMVSGYFLYDEVGSKQFKQKLVQRLKKNSILLGSFVLFYLIVDIVKTILKSESIAAYFSSLLHWNEVAKMVLVNNFPSAFGGVILWFLFAMLYIYIFNIWISNILRKEHIKPLAVLSSIVLVTANILILLFTALGNSVLNGVLSSHWIYSNWLISGLPCFYIGMQCKNIINNHLDRIKKYRNALFASFAMLILINYAFCWCIDRYLHTYISYTPFTIMLDVVIFCLSAVITMKDDNYFVKLGEKYSRDVYILHPLVMSATSILNKSALISSAVGTYLQPIVVIIGSFLVSMVLEGILNIYRNRKSMVG